MSGIRAHILGWFGLVALACADEPPAIIDCHVHLWDIARPAGLGWIKKDDKTLYRSFLPADHESIARANGVSGIVVVQAGQSLPDNQWNLDITAHNPRLYRGVVGNFHAEPVVSDARSIENALHRGDIEAARALMPGFVDSLAQLVKVLREHDQLR